MRRTTTATLAIAAVFALAACGGSDATTTTVQPTTNTAAETTTTPSDSAATTTLREVGSRSFLGTTKSSGCSRRLVRPRLPNRSPRCNSTLRPTWASAPTKPSP